MTGNRNRVAWNILHATTRTSTNTDGDRNPDRLKFMIFLTNKICPVFSNIFIFKIYKKLQIFVGFVIYSRFL